MTGSLDKALECLSCYMNKSTTDDLYYSGTLRKNTVFKIKYEEVLKILFIAVLGNSKLGHVQVLIGERLLMTMSSLCLFL